MRWRINISSRIMSETGDVYATIDDRGKWWFNGNPSEATTWDRYDQALAVSARCPDIGPKVVMIEPVDQ